MTAQIRHIYDEGAVVLRHHVDRRHQLFGTEHQLLPLVIEEKESGPKLMGGMRQQGTVEPLGRLPPLLAGRGIVAAQQYGVATVVKIEIQQRNLAVMPVGQRHGQVGGHRAGAHPAGGTHHADHPSLAQ